MKTKLWSLLKENDNEFITQYVSKVSKRGVATIRGGATIRGIRYFQFGTVRLIIFNPSQLNVIKYVTKRNLIAIIYRTYKAAYQV